MFEALLQQPQWSDLPVVLLGKADTSPEVESLIGRMTNVTVLERPSSSRTLLSAIRTSLRARHRQYEMRDQVTALHEAETALRQTDRRKDEFLAMLAHELRNPLAPIRTASDLLPRIVPPGDERVDSTLRVVKRQVGQLSRLVDDLLDVSRITQGRIELQPEVLDLASIVAQALESVEPLMTEKRHVVLAPGPICRAACLRRPGTTGAMRVEHPRQCSQVHGRRRQDPDRSAAARRVRGAFRAGQWHRHVTTELLPKIFDLFVQSERSLDRSEGGLGIGLSVVKQLVEMHNGTVRRRSAGLGTGFHVRDPSALVAAPGRKCGVCCAAPGVVQARADRRRQP